MFHFTIRELVLLTLVVGLVFGWGIDHWQQSGSYRRLHSDYGQATWNYTWCAIKLKELGYTPVVRDERIYSFKPYFTQKASPYEN